MKSCPLIMEKKSCLEVILAFSVFSVAAQQTFSTSQRPVPRGHHQLQRIMRKRGGSVAMVDLVQT